MISPDFLMNYAASKGVFYIWDVNGDGVVDTKDVDKIAQSQAIMPIEQPKQMIRLI